MNGASKADAIRETLERLVHDGVLTPEAVVSEARDPTSPLHTEFEWNDSVAATAHRLAQARKIIRSVRIEIIEEKRVLDSVCYVRDPDLDHDEAGYAAVMDLRDDTDRARRALLNELARAEAYIARVRSLAVGLGFENGVEVVERDMAILRKAIEKVA